MEQITNNKHLACHYNLIDGQIVDIYERNNGFYHKFNRLSNITFNVFVNIISNIYEKIEMSCNYDSETFHQCIKTYIMDMGYSDKLDKQIRIPSFITDKNNYGEQSKINFKPPTMCLVY